MKNKINYLLLFLGTLFIFSSSAMAKPVITSVVEQFETSGTRDLYLVTVDPKGETITGYLITTDANGTNGESYSTSASRQYLTIPNGLYYIWVKTTSSTSDPYKINVTNSCSDDPTVTNATGTGRYERCYRRFSNGTEIPVSNATDATCAAGYNMDAAYSTISANDCSNKRAETYGLPFRYCRKAYNYKCVKVQTSGGSSSGTGGTSTPSSASNSNAKLSSLSVSSGTLTPGFQPSTYTYAVTTDATQVTISATLMKSSASFVNGYGPRSVALNYGTNTVQIKTQDGNTVNTYTIKIKRADQRSSVNTLSNLSVSKGSLAPEFNSLTNSYNVHIDKDVESLDINAALSDANSSFVEGYGPRTIQITGNSIRESIKVKSQSGRVRTYSLLFIKDGNEEQAAEEDNHALLKKLELSAGKIEFDPKTWDYNVTVPYDVTNTVVTAEAQDPNDEVVVTGGENIEADKLNEITVVVTSSDGQYTHTYTIYLIRKNEDIEVSHDSYLADLSIEGYKIKFDAKNTNYKVSVKEGTKSLVIYATPADSKATISIEGNEDLQNGSQVKVRVTAEDNSYTDYLIDVKMVGKGGNTFLTIVVIILIILAIAYLVLRAMGYKIYLNIGAFTDKIKGMFKRN